MGEHSPLPWRWEGMSRGIIASDNSTVGALDWGNDNAEAIHCVNVHDDLVNALEEIQKRLQSTSTIPSHEVGSVISWCDDECRRAIAKAKAGA